MSASGVQQGAGEAPRFADYFFQVGLLPSSNLEEKRYKGPASGEAERSPEITDEAGGLWAIKLGFGKPEQGIHPINFQYHPEVLTRYPTADYPDGPRFPPFLPMFCFPNELQLRHEESGKPPERYHSFIITEETGAKSYGICLTFYEPLPSHLASQMETMIQEWREGSLVGILHRIAENYKSNVSHPPTLLPKVASDLEYIQHIRSQLAMNQETLLRARMGLRDPRQMDEDPATLVTDAEEKVEFYKNLLEPMKNSTLVDQDNVYVPRCIGVLSHWPWHDFLKDWLCEVLKVVRGDYDEVEEKKATMLVPLERYIVHLLHEIPLPPPGKLELSIHVGQLRLYISRPPVNSISVLKNFSFYPFFRCLSVANALTVVELVLGEKKIIFLSSHLGMLTLAAETVSLLIYPLYWQHILIPVLPARLLSYLQAPMPYIVGIQREYADLLDADEGRPADATLVDLDNDMLTLGSTAVPLPPRERKKLVSRLEKCTGPFNTPMISPYRNAMGGEKQRPAQRGPPCTLVYAMPYNTNVARTAESVRKTNFVKPVESRPPPFPKRTAASDPTSAAGSREHLPRLSMDKGPRSVGTPLSAIGMSSARSGSSMDIATMTPSFESRETLTSTGSNHAPGGGDYGHTFIPESGGDTMSRTSSTRFNTVSAPGWSEEEDDNVSISPGKAPSVYSVRSFPVFGSKNKSEEKPTPGMVQSPSSGSLSSFFSGFSSMSPSRSNTLPNARSRFRPSGVASPSEPDTSRRSTNRFSISAGSSNSSGTTTGSVFYEGMQRVEENLIGVPIRKKEGHLFREMGPQDLHHGSTDSMEGHDSMGRQRRPSSAGRMRILGGPRSELRQDPEFARSRSRSNSREENYAGNARSRSRSSTLIGSGDVPDIGLCAMCREDWSGSQDGKFWRCEGESDFSVASELTQGSPCPAVYNEAKIQSSFFKIFTSLLKNYRQYLIWPEEENLKKHLEDDAVRKGRSDFLEEEWFRKEDFLSCSDKDCRPFMSQLVETQAFTQFTLDRLERPETDFEVLFFDESVKEKRNRSKLRFSKDTTPFLKETAYDVAATVDVVGVNLEGLELGRSYGHGDAFPVELDTSLMVPPRPVKPLVTQSDHRIMKSHTHELVQRARMAANAKRKQDFSKWMKVKWKHFQQLGNGEVVSIGFLSDEQRREMFEERLKQVSDVIDQYEAAHLSVQTREQVQDAIDHLHEQNDVLMRATDEEQLVDSGEQEELHMILSRLIRVITIYEDFLGTFKPTIPGRADSRRQSISQEGSAEFLGRLSVGPKFDRVASWAAAIVAAGEQAGGAGSGEEGGGGVDDDSREGGTDDAPDAVSVPILPPKHTENRSSPQLVASPPSSPKPVREEMSASTSSLRESTASPRTPRTGLKAFQRPLTVRGRRSKPLPEIPTRRSLSGELGKGSGGDLSGVRRKSREELGRKSSDVLSGGRRSGSEFGNRDDERGWSPSRKPGEQGL
ncbi:hypothetical protein HDV00_012249 [Rhizophlyctis rosea]|nr:hypothetical protein HDV00_012249 [Rhizophlyctis rosea]